MTASTQHNIVKSSDFFKKIVLNFLAQINYGKIILLDGHETYIFGNNTDTNQPAVTFKVMNKQVYKNTILKGSIGFAESYIFGQWDVDDLTKFIEIGIKNANIFNGIDGGLSAIYPSILRFINFIKKNNLKNSRENILAHYDLGNEFFELFLDKRMMYSCAVYPPESTDLDAASLNKIDIICKALKLLPSDQLLEIGSGWGSFALHAAQQYGCKVTTTTLSNKQFQYVKDKVQQQHMQDKITVLNEDYRSLQGKYDKLVSIEMIEAVGHRYFDVFFKKCDALLKINGLMFLQAIVINDQDYPRIKNSVDFIKKYIFPGGCLPSVSEICRCVAKKTNLQLLAINDIGMHYAQTLSDWRARFEKNLFQIEQLGFSKEFVRMWRYYLCYCEACFKQKQISDIHALWQKRAE